MDKYLPSLVGSAVKLAKAVEADAILYLLDKPVDLSVLKKKSNQFPCVIAVGEPEWRDEHEEAGHSVVLIENTDAPVNDRLAQAVLECVADEFLKPGSTVVAVYSGFDQEQLESITVLTLTEHLGRLTARDLQRLETNVPLETLRTVVELAVDIGREGREGKPVGTIFLVGDHRNVLEDCQAGGFDFTKGYSRKERNLNDAKVREGIKELAQLDGAFVVSADGTVEASCQIIDTARVDLTMTTGLGARHFAAAAISKNTKAISIVVSESNGTVRLFRNGEVMLRIEPMRRPMKWKGFSPDADPKMRES